jgi:uncharacterized protein YegP (UPF0339 family)
MGAFMTEPIQAWCHHDDGTEHPSDGTLPCPRTTPATHDHAVIWRDHGKRWRYHVVAANGRVVSTSGQGFVLRRSAVKAVQRERPGIPVKEIQP